MEHASDLVRPELRRIAPYNAGLTLEEVRHRYRVTDIAKLGSNENPLGPSKKIMEIGHHIADLSKLYPDPQGRALCERLAALNGVEPNQIILGNGSEDLIGVICRSVVRPGDEVVTLYPSFPLHEDYAVLMGGRVTRVSVTADLEIDIDKLTSSTNAAPRMVMFSNPMNPVGVWLDVSAMRRLLQAHKPNTLLVVDDAYAEYAAGSDYPDTVALLSEQQNDSWVVLRTFSKAYGLAGLRIGYAVVGNPDLANYFNRARTPFNTNAIAQASALMALDDLSHLQRSVELAKRERERVAGHLVSLGYKVARSKGNFLFFKVNQDADSVAELLLQQGVIVKPWKQEGFKEFIRVSIGDERENDQFLAAVENLTAARTPA